MAQLTQNQETLQKQTGQLKSVMGLQRGKWPQNYDWSTTLFFKTDNFEKLMKFNKLGKLYYQLPSFNAE